jgi:putative transposase
LIRGIPGLSIRKKCALLSVNRSLLYYVAVDDTEEVWLANTIRDIWLKHTFYGYRKITVILRADYKLLVNGKRVLRLMRQLNIQAVYPKPQLSRNKLGNKSYKYLLKGLTIIKVNQAWQVDITYLRLCTRFVYLVALIDIYSRYIVGWNLSFGLDAQNCLDALNIALKVGRPEIINSDLGCQFTSEEWTATLLKLNILLSFDGKGRYVDNIYIERFWRTIKYEAVYLNSYNDFTELYVGTNNYIKFYNEERPHQSIGYLRPKDIYKKI